MAKHAISEQLLAQQFSDMVNRGVFRCAARHLRGVDAEDRLADAIAATWMAYRNCGLNRGEELPVGALVIHCKRRALDWTRRFVGGINNADVMAEATYRSGRVQLERRSGFDDDAHDVQHRVHPEPALISTIDVRSWLAELPEEDVAILNQRLAGESLGAIAAGRGVSVARVFRRLRSLGHALAERAGLTVCAAKRARHALAA